MTVLVIVVAIAVVGGVVAALLLSRGHGHGSRSATAPTTVAGGALTPGSTASTAPSAAPNTAQTTVPGGAVTSVPGGGVTTTAPGSPAQAMQTLGGYLAQTAGVRKNVQTAVAGVQGCTIPPATGSQTLQGAISTRQQVLAALPSINVASLPNGTQLVSALTQALQQSITADQGYQAWMSDIGAGKLACNADPSGDAGFQQGQAASASATASKTSFTTLWDPLATEYGQPTYQPADL